ncbi:UNVERIFIED_CONTAM: hypothetical protein FKN15_057139 [Acipenser sinensis]
MEKLPDDVNIPELMSKVEERTPYIVVAIQECERMNMLTPGDQALPQRAQPGAESEVKGSWMLFIKQHKATGRSHQCSHVNKYVISLGTFPEQTERI